MLQPDPLSANEENKSPDDVLSKWGELRTTAEKLAQRQNIDLSKIEGQDFAYLMHELSVHQIELELQNEELLRAQQQLQLSHRNFFQLYHHAPVGYLRIDEHCIIKQCNQQFLNWIGLKQQRVESHPLAEFIAENDRTAFLIWWRSQSLRHEQPSFQIRTQDGREMHVSISITELIWDDSAYLLLVMTDITALKIAETKLTLAATVFDTAQEGCLVTDAFLSVILVNQALCKITGYAKEELIGQTPALFKSGRHEPKFYQEFWNVLMRKGYWEGEIWNRRKNGEIYPAWLCVNSVLNAQGTPYRFIGMLSDISERKRKDDIILCQATQDMLTGLANRALFIERLQLAIMRSQRNKERIALMLLDLDGFKEINDSLGHDVGDILLQEIAVRIRGSVREVDTVARLGGDEFILMLENYGDFAGHLDQIAEKVLEAIAKPVKSGEEVIYVTASLGIAFFPEDASNAVELQKCADQAMYHAKHEGKNRFSYFMPEMQKAVQVRHQIAHDLRVAIEHNHLRAFYQPIVRLSDSSVVKAEALIRWQHPEKGLISPAGFIPIAEETGLIDQLGNWMFQQVSRDVERWIRQGHDLQVSINVSSTQLSAPSDNFMRMVQKLSEEQLAHYIVIELTERLLVEHSERVDINLLTLRDAGIEVALDDFGTGYSSLSYLQEFDIDYLKIDQSFITRLKPNSNSHTLCEAVIVMAHSLGIRVIAEGIETLEQQALLTAMGCDYGQGYLFARPMPADEFEAKLTGKSESTKL